MRRVCRPVLVGEPSVWKRAGWSPALAPLVDTGLGLKPPPWGAPSADGGRASFAAVRLGVRLVREGAAAGVVTAPVSKLAWRRAGVSCRDHTEFLEKETGCATRMILAAPASRLWTICATRHIPLARVARSLDRRELAACAGALDQALKRLGCRRPRLALCALNPHGGEEGLMGSEEARLLEPAARASRRARIALAGPLPADTAWRWHCSGRLDGLVCLYHDQAMIPLKVAAGLEIVNWTVGIPFPRTSPGHGTGFDLAGSRKPDPSPTLAAARLAARLAA
ncbi:MAG: 4-hydroxythreonine-4-phosphate dehydrogenase PdxA [Elusimicrobia bacterium]|nr:4-hydroxythreonine-4-phosphate dehydrogenase PdxA [Elusimicrobiota bacterium]